MIKQSNATGQPQAGLKSVIFEKESYLMRPVKNGDRPANGDVVTTGKDGKVRLIFRNGDQVTVTPGTAFKFTWNPKTERNAVAELVYGDIRAVIQPEGPRSGMKVNTKTAVLGVRGTDFYVSSWSKEAGSKVAVMRGAVALAPKIVTAPGPDQNTVPAPTKDPNSQKANAPKPPTAPRIQEVIVSAGSSGTVTQKPVIPAENLALTGNTALIDAPIVAVERTSKQELVVIQADSKVAKPKVDEIAKSADPIVKEIAKLEATSVDTTLKDVKRYDPELYAKIKEEAKKGTHPVDADHVQAETVKKIFVTAPSVVSEPHKPTLEDLETGGDIYDKYKWEKN
jgi:hypothetical protein